jgi:hypothetical protein
VWLPDARHSRVAYWGAPQTIQVMAKAALEDTGHFDTRRLVETVCEKLDSKDYTSEYIACLNFLLQRTRYMRDPRTVELVRAPYIISQQIIAGRRPSIDCDDMTTWLAAAVLALGGQARFVTVAFAHQFFGGRRQFSHVYLQAYEPRNGTWIALDPVAAEKTPQMLARVKAYDVWPLTT